MTKDILYPYPIHKTKLDNGCEIAYMDEGKGSKTLVFIHGLALYAPSWRKNIAYLKQYYRCIAIDLPGNGLSSKGDYPYSIKFFSACIYEFIKKNNLKNVCLVGHSMGGQIAATTIINHPGCATELILCAPAGFEIFSGFEKSLYHSSLHLFDFFSSEEHSLKKTIQSSFFHRTSQGDDMADELAILMRAYPVNKYKVMIESCIKGMLDEPVFENLYLIKQHCLVLFGERDALIPNKFIHPISTKKLAEDATKRIPDCKLVMIPQCGHLLQIEKEKEVNHDIHDFLK